MIQKNQRGTIPFWGIVLAAVIVIAVGFYLAARGGNDSTAPEQETETSQDNTANEPTASEPVDESVNSNSPGNGGATSAAPEEGAGQEPQTTWQGAVLASGASPVIDFNPADYQAALEDRTLVVLYFYANWCPICREEIPKFYSALEQINNPEVIAFRVSFNDSDTDDAERNLARDFGIAYQHSKVFLKNGERVLKSPESWDKQRYLDEVANALN